MHRRVALHLLAALTVAAATAGCDRNVEPFDPNEKPHEPDLSKIFPEGAEQDEPALPTLPPAPGQGRGAAPVAQGGGAGGDAAPIVGRVELDPQLESSAPADAVLFIIARRGGGGPPLAVKRVVGPHFPFEFRIGPDDRMIQTMPFAGPIRLSARLDADGDAASRSAGDLQGLYPTPVDPGATDVVIRLDTAL